MTGTTSSSSVANSLGWVLDEGIKLPGARCAILLSRDGLRMAHSRELTQDDSEKHAAAMSGIRSLSHALSDFVTVRHGEGGQPTRWRQTLMEYEDGWAVLAAAGNGALLGVSAEHSVDLHDLAYAMTKLVDRLGEVMAIEDRRAPGSTS